MKSNTKILNVQSNGQVSLGKAFAGELLQMELLPDGRILLTPITVRPKHHETFFTDEAREQLQEFKAWRKKNPSSEDAEPAEELLTQLLKGKE